MSYRKRLILTLALPSVVLAIAGSSAGGCGTTADTENGPGNAINFYYCSDPHEEFYDDFGQWDPCCNLKACCPSPNLEHFVKITDDPAANHVWDPCCLFETCPEVNVWLPKPDPAPPSPSEDAGASLCPGQCVPMPPEGWFLPALVWHGPLDQEPGCPVSAPFLGYQGKADLIEPPNSCGICGCSSPVGQCELPSHLLASSANACAAGGILTPFDGPAGWDGSCTSQNAIPGGAQCNGGPCVKSLLVNPLTLTETEGCTPHVIVPKDGPPPAPAWKTSALACQVSDYPPCSPTQVCAPAAEAGFSTCIFAWGDEHKCPTPYTEKQVFYDDYSDTLACSACSCAPAVGSLCTAQLSLYTDTSCSVPLQMKDITLSSTDPACSSILPPGLPLGSKTITKPTYSPGTCKPSGGELTGDLSPIGAATFCCLQS